jgi:hypothetical protein
MPINYALGKIYKIVDNTNDQCYVGSTCEPILARRLAKHVASYKCHLNGKQRYVSSYEILKNGDYDIVLIENFPCNNRDELHARERYWTNEIPCVNKYRNQGIIAELGQVDYGKQYCVINADKIKEKLKAYYENNADKIKEKSKAYYENNVDKIKEKSKEYYDTNKVKIDEYNKKYFELNGDKIKEKLHEKFNCDCGGKYTLNGKSHHLKTIKHIKYIETQQADDAVIEV